MPNLTKITRNDTEFNEDRKEDRMGTRICCGITCSVSDVRMPCRTVLKAIAIISLPVFPLSEQVAQLDKRLECTNRLSPVDS